MSCGAYVCYILSNRVSHTYVGITNNLNRRLRQHNGEIKGGARATRGKGPWFVEGHITGFRAKRDCLSFEWHMHHKQPRSKYVGSASKRIACAIDIMRLEKFAHLALETVF